MEMGKWSYHLRVNSVVPVHKSLWEYINAVRYIKFRAPKVLINMTLGIIQESAEYNWEVTHRGNKRRNDHLKKQKKETQRTRGCRHSSNHRVSRVQGAFWAAYTSIYLNRKDGHRCLREPGPIKVLLRCIKITHEILKTVISSLLNQNPWPKDHINLKNI